MDIVVKLASPGLDPLGVVARMLDGAVHVEPYDPDLSLEAQVADADVLLVRAVPITADVINAAPRLRLVIRPGVHVYGVDTDFARSLGIPVCNTPPEVSIGGRGVGEHAAALMFALAKRLNESQAGAAAGLVGEPSTITLEGKQLGMVGIGRTGDVLLAVGKALGMRVAAVQRTSTSEHKARLGLDWIGAMSELPELLANSDVVSLHIPLVDEYVGMIGAAELARMKPGALLVNNARAALVDREALTASLAAEHLGGYAADVWWEEPIPADDPLVRDPRVVVTPHNAAVSIESNDMLYGAVVENIRRVMLEGKAPKYQVN